MMMRASRVGPIAALIACATASCAGAQPVDTKFTGRFDEEVYQRYYTDQPRDDLRKRCEAISFTPAEWDQLVASYDEAIAYHANYTLAVTACSVEGETLYKGRKAKFLWYPSGYIRFDFPDDEGAEPEFRICRGTTDEEGIFSCDQEFAW